MESETKEHRHRMTLDFNKYAAKGNEFLHSLESCLGNEDRGHAARILRTTFRVLRNHLTVEESLQLIAQLPMAIKAVYVDGWSTAKHKRITVVDDFLMEVRLEDGNKAWRDFGSREEVLECIDAVIQTMAIYISSEEMEQAIGTLPKKLRQIFKSSEL
jgi:uncharacterized protein (DUF2267 family)